MLGAGILPKSFTRTTLQQLTARSVASVPGCKNPQLRSRYELLEAFVVMKPAPKARCDPCPRFLDRALIPADDAFVSEEPAAGPESCRCVLHKAATGLTEIY